MLLELEPVLESEVQLVNQCNQNLERSTQCNGHCLLLPRETRTSPWRKFIGMYLYKLAFYEERKRLPEHQGIQNRCVLFKKNWWLGIAGQHMRTILDRIPPESIAQLYLGPGRSQKTCNR